jgi:sporulation protein YlmC with PRC-barrel domain
MTYEARIINDKSESNAGGIPGPDTRRGPGPNVMGASALVGSDVFSHQAEYLGTIKEIMLDMRSGSVSYAALSFAAVLGTGEKREKLFAVPWAALTLNTAERCMQLNVDKARLQLAPGFDKGNWPDVADPAWQKEIDAYYGTTPFPKDRPIA